MEKQTIVNLKVIIMLLCIVLMKLSKGTTIEYVWATAALFYLIKIIYFLSKKIN